MMLREGAKIASSHPAYQSFKLSHLCLEKPNKINRAKRIPLCDSFGEKARVWALRHLISGGTIKGFSLNPKSWIRNDEAVTINVGCRINVTISCRVRRMRERPKHRFTVLEVRGQIVKERILLNLKQFKF